MRCEYSSSNSFFLRSWKFINFVFRLPGFSSNISGSCVLSIIFACCRSLNFFSCFDWIPESILILLFYSLIILWTLASLYNRSIFWIFYFMSCFNSARSRSSLSFCSTASVYFFDNVAYFWKIIPPSLSALRFCIADKGSGYLSMTFISFEKSLIFSNLWIYLICWGLTDLSYTPFLAATISIFFSN